MKEPMDPTTKKWLIGFAALLIVVYVARGMYQGDWSLSGFMGSDESGQECC